mmetsp:Transcript_142867/g.398011  ORF Transcript_142867/g.398011 Transcript_142867/m.398011 type:complete len:218 (-) Transcript_142867:950-1603(-)
MGAVAARKTHPNSRVSPLAWAQNTTFHISSRQLLPQELCIQNLPYTAHVPLHVRILPIWPGPCKSASSPVVHLPQSVLLQQPPSHGLQQLPILILQLREAAHQQREVPLRLALRHVDNVSDHEPGRAAQQRGVALTELPEAPDEVGKLLGFEETQTIHEEVAQERSCERMHLLAIQFHLACCPDGGRYVWRLHTSCLANDLLQQRFHGSTDYRGSAT